MRKDNQSLLEFLENLPMSSFAVDRDMLSNKEAQTLYDLWSKGETDEYVRLVVSSDIDPMHITSLTTKGYILNHPSRYVIGRVPERALELTKKAKEVIQKIILHKEKSAFEKSSSAINYEAICRKEEADARKNSGKVASRKHRTSGSNWFTRVTWK